jgi:hypothetical protein
MPLHNWERVETGIFHAFHTTWIAAIQNALNEGVLPEGYYALAEQHAGQAIADVLTLHASPPPVEPPSLPPATGGTAVAEAPPRARRRYTVEPSLLVRQRSVAVRHVSGHRLVALIEIVSPANKDRERHVEAFAAKAASALGCGIHLLLVDLLRPGVHDPWGMHGAILRQLEQDEGLEAPPPDEPATLVSYAAGSVVEVFLEHVALSNPLPDMALFLRPDRYVAVPLEATYQGAFHGMPAFWREVLNRGLPDPLAAGE